MLLVLLLVSLLTACSEKPLKFHWEKGDYTKAPKNGKIIMIDLWSVSCGPCIKYQKTTFKDEDVIKFAKDNFNCYKYDAWDKKNYDIAVKFIKEGIPLIVFLDENLNEIDRISEYLNAEDFLKETKRILDGNDVFNQVKLEYEKEPENLNKLYKYALKIDKKEGAFHDEVISLYKKYVKKAEEKTYQSDFAKYRLSYAALYKQDNPEPITELIDSLPYRDYLITAMEKVTQYYRDNNKYLLLSEFYETINHRLYKFIKENNDYRYINFMNNAAWDLYQSNLKPKLQLELIQYVIDNASESGDAPNEIANYYDSYARILFTQGDINKAKLAVEEGLKIDSENRDLKATKDLIAKNKKM